MPYLLKCLLARFALGLLRASERLRVGSLRKHVQVRVVHLRAIRLHYKVRSFRNSSHLVQLVQDLVAGGDGLSVAEVHDENHRLVIPQEVLANERVLRISGSVEQRNFYRLVLKLIAVKRVHAQRGYLSSAEGTRRITAECGLSASTRSHDEEF